MFASLLIAALSVFPGHVDETTGALTTPRVGNRYFVMTRSGDVEALETEDRVVETKRDGEAVEYRCRNEKLPGLDIVKRYFPRNGGLGRTLVFLNHETETKYITPFTECRFEAAFLADAYHFGAGYLGPFKPFPKVAAPKKLDDEYLQSSKGIVLVNEDVSLGSFAHYRVKIDDTVVLPWWHSTIGHYREYHDRLWYLPGGYRMGLGTFGLQTGRPVAVTEEFRAFKGDLFTFFDEVFAKDPDVAAELASIPPAPGWLADVFANAEDRTASYPEWLLRMLEDGEMMLHCGPALGTYSWGDYRKGRGGYPTYHGGHITDSELQAFLDRFKAMAPGRVHVSNYGITVSAGDRMPIMKEHPEWYRRRDRDGKDDSLFPGVALNWQTMFSEPDAREWIARMFWDMADGYGLDTVYLDETQMTNTIDWEHDRVTRDDDSVKFWQRFTAEKARRGKDRMFFANGSGIPYVDLNYIEECRGTLRPDNWRDGAGVLLGVAMVNRMRKSGRIVPLYWSRGNDYANRILALGWIPRPQCVFGNEVAVIRAAWQNGAMFPIAAKYSPDWKRDPQTEVESYAVAREGRPAGAAGTEPGPPGPSRQTESDSKRTTARDVVISFINRAKDVRDIPVEIDLATLGFAAGTRINVFRQHHDDERAGTRREEMLDDKSIRENWKHGVLEGARFSDPELVYSGDAKGTFRTVLKGLDPGKMEQLVAVAGPVSLFSENGRPLNAFFTSQRQATVAGRKVRCEREVEVLLIDRELGFEAVTVNGKPVETRPVRVGDLTGRLVRLGPGEWTLGWKTTAASGETTSACGCVGLSPSARVSSAQADGSAGQCGRDKARPSPGVSVPVFERKWVPELSRVEAAPVKGKYHGRILRKQVYRSGVDAANRMQEESGLDFSAVAADEKTATLVAGTTRREGEIEDMVNFAGFEIDDSRILGCRLTPKFGGTIDYVVLSGHAAPWVFLNRTDVIFAGIYLDYRVGGKYVKRVALSVGLKQKEISVKLPKIGTGEAPTEYLELGDWLDSEKPIDFELDLRKYAPKGWDGTVWLSLGTSGINAGRSMTLELLDFTDKAEYKRSGTYADPDPLPADIPATLKAMERVKPAVAEVKKTAAGAALFVDGRKSNACFYSGEYDFRLAGEVGVDLVVAAEGAGTEGMVKELLRVYNANPKARVLISVDLSPSKEFLEAHPEMIFTDDRGVRGRVHTSVCDEYGNPLHEQNDFDGFGNQPLGQGETWAFSYTGHLWREWAERKLDDVVRKLKATPAGNIVIGFHFTGGMDGQYVQWEYGDLHGHFDYSEAYREGLREYVKELYGTEAALRAAWGDDRLSFDTVANPTVAEYRSKEFFDDRPGFGRRLADCRRFVSVSLSRSLNHYAHYLKKAWGRPAVVELWWTTAIWPQAARLAIDELIAGGAVDIVKTVSYYAPERSIGGIGASANNLAESLDRRGVLYVQELDHRTRRSGRVDNIWWADDKVARPDNPQDFDLQITRDAFSVIAIGGRGLCFYDMLGSWYHAPEEKATLAKLVKAKEFADAGAGGYERPETVILMDEKMRLLSEKRAYENPGAVWRTSGVVPSIRLTSDLDDDAFPSYRLAFLWNDLTLSKAHAAKLRAAAEQGMTLVVVGRVGVCSLEFADENEALAALGPKAIRVADPNTVTPERINEFARKAGARVFSAPGNAVYIGNGVAAVHRLAGPVGIDFGREVTPYDPATGKALKPLRYWKPEIPVKGLATMLYR